MKPLIFLILLLTPLLINATEEQRKIAHEFAKIFIESNIPMYIRQKLRDNLKNALFDPWIINKFEFKDCEGKEYNADEFVDNYLLAGKLGENLRIDEKGEYGMYKRQGFQVRTYLTHFHTNLDSYSVSVTASNASPDLQFYSIIAKCYTKYCN